MSEHINWMVVFVWPVLSAFLNAAFRMKTPDAWWEFAKVNPRTAGLVRLVSATGLDGAKALSALRDATGQK